MGALRQRPPPVFLNQASETRSCRPSGGLLLRLQRRGLLLEQRAALAGDDVRRHDSTVAGLNGEPSASGPTLSTTTIIRGTP
jgi:hypothetical protein